MAKTEAERKAERLALITGGRPAGSGATNREPIRPLKVESVELGPVVYLSPTDLKPNPRNPYPPLEPDELQELADDIAEKGQIVPSIAYPDKTLICGHNRRDAAIIARKGGARNAEKVPVQYVFSDLSKEAERDLMRSENDRRRGGKWSADKKREWIEKHFGEEIDRDRRGGDRKSASSKIKIRNGGFDPEESANLTKKIETASKGKIPGRTAERIVSEIRKGRKAGEEGKTAALTATQRKQAERLAGQIRDLEGKAERLKKQAKEAEEQAKAKRKLLRQIGEPSFFGV